MHRATKRERGVWAECIPGTRQVAPRWAPHGSGCWEGSQSEASKRRAPCRDLEGGFLTGTLAPGSRPAADSMSRARSEDKEAGTGRQMQVRERWAGRQSTGPTWLGHRASDHRHEVALASQRHPTGF